jgi:hypothetical protein
LDHNTAQRAALAALASAQRLPPGPQALAFASNVDDSDQVYGLFLPRNFGVRLATDRYRNSHAYRVVFDERWRQARRPDPTSPSRSC